jgi:PKD repeat protein
VVGGTIIGGWNSNAITVQWPATPGNYSISANWNNILLGCSGQAQLNVKVKPEFNVFAPPGPFCLGDSTMYSATAPANWTVTGGTFTGNGSPSIMVTWTTPGVHTVTATPLNPNAFCVPSVTLSATVVTVPPAASFTGADSVCAGGLFTYTAVASGPGYTFLWTVTGGTIIGSPTANPVTVQWSTGGTISVQQVQTVSPNCPSPPISKTVTVIPPPAITGNTVVCMDQSYTYTAGPPNPYITYNWSIVDNSNNPSPAGSITSGQGSNSIQVLWHGPGGSAVVKLDVCGSPVLLPVTINPKPTPTISMVGAVCDPGGSVTLTVNPSYTSYLWSNGATTQSTVVNASGQYCVTVTNANGCTENVCITVPHTPGPVASISTPDPTRYCIPPGPISTTLHALQGPGYTFQWFPGGQTTPVITATSLGNYYVVVTDANGCTATSNVISVVADSCKPDTCQPQPYTLDFTFGPSGISCNTIDFTSTTSNVTSLAWTFGDGGSAGNVPVTTYTYASAGYYHATLCGQVPAIPSGFCSACVTKVVTIPVAADFAYVVNCGMVTFTDHSTHLPSNPITSWQWSFGGGSPATFSGQTPPPVSFTPGSHVVTLTVSDGGCTSTKSFTINVPAPPSAAFTLPPTACVGLSIPLSGSGGVTHWAWNFGDAATSALQNTSHAWATAGTFTVTLVVKNNAGCTDSVSQTITITSPSNTCSILPSSPATICQGDSILLTASAGTTYQWSLNGLPISGATNQTYYASQTGNYTVAITDPNGCTCITPGVMVTTKPVPPATITAFGSQLICGSGNIMLTAPYGPSYTYLWSDASTMQFLSLTLSIPGTYTYTVTVTDTSSLPWCSTTSAPFTILVFPPPAPVSITAGGPTQLCRGDSVTLTSSSPVNNLWSTGALTQSITVFQSGTYTVAVTDPNGCVATASIGVTVNPLPDFSLYPIGCDTLCDTVQIPGPIGNFPGYYTYQWYFNGNPIPAPNGTNQQLTPVGNGSYTLVMTGPAPTFCVDTSNAYNLSTYSCDSLECTGKICGRKWHDLNGNHKFNYGVEYGVPNWKICLVKCNVDGYPSPDTVACTTTDSAGFYCFTNLCDGEYCVVEQTKPGWAQTWPVNPPFYHVTIVNGQIVQGLDFGNKKKCIDIWVTIDTIGVPPIDILQPTQLFPPNQSWPVRISYSEQPGLPFTPIFEGIISANVVPFNPCNPGYYSIVKKSVANYRSDRIYVNGVLQTWQGDSTVVHLSDTTDGISVVFLQTTSVDSSVSFRTFTAAQLASDGQAKPVKRPRPKKPGNMPNTANVIDEMLRQGKTLIVGLPAQLNSGGKEKAYLTPIKQGDVYKTLNTRGVKHTKAAHGLDFDAKGKPILKRKKNMPATKYDNVLLANLLALKINIAASDAGKTPVGFGDLLYLPANGELPDFMSASEYSVREIGELADEMMTNWEGHTFQEFDELNAIIVTLNSAFEGPSPFTAADTLTWVTGGKLALSGARPLADVPFLIKVNGAPRMSHQELVLPPLPPDVFSLEQNYPNPFNPTTMIGFSLNEDAYVSLSVYDVLGREVATLLNHEMLDADAYEVQFDAGQVASGLYFYKLMVETLGDEDGETAGTTYLQVRKMVLMK